MGGEEWGKIERKEEFFFPFLPPNFFERERE